MSENKPTYTLPLTLTIDEEFLSGLITTAVEGGIGYWSCCSNYKWDYGQDEAGNDLTGPTTVTVHESVDDIDYDGPTIEGHRGGEYKAEGVTVGPAQMLAALAIICDLSKPLEHVSDRWRTSVLAAVRDPEGAGDLDSGDCDNIMQIAVLGAVVYG